MNFAEKHPFFLTRTGSLVLHFGLAVTGACSAAMFPALNWSLLAWIALLPLILLCRSCSVRSAFLRGLTWGYFWSLFSFLWLREIALPIPFILSFVLALFVAAWSAYYNFLWRHLSVAPADRLEGGAHCAELVPFRRPLHGIFFMLANAGMWCVLEWLRGWIMTGLPWDYLGTSQWRNLPLIQICEFTGVFGVSFLVAAVNLGLGLALVSFRPDSGWGRAYRRPWPLLAAFALLLACYVSGLHLLRANRLDESAVRHVNIGVIQPNLSQRRNADHAAAKEALDVCTDLTERLLDRDEKLRNLVPVGNAPNRKLDLIVWPETALTVTIDRSAAARDRLSRLARETGATLLVGVFTSGTGTESNRQYNSVVAFLPDGSMCETVYSKQKPVPFGEFVPYRELVMLLVPPLADIGMLENDLLVGDRSEVFDLGVGRVGSLICFDSIYESTALDSVRRGAQLLAVSTNDSWFQDSRGVWMHNAQSSLRAIETGRYVVRAGNTGVSSVIAPTGQVTAELDPLLTGYVPGTVRLCEERTLYTRIGNLFAYLCAALCAAAVLANPAEMVMRRLRAGRKSE